MMSSRADVGGASISRCFVSAHYGVFGSAISFLVRRESPATLNRSDADNECFFCYEWVDDHVLIEVDRENRLERCDVALRLAMLAVLGPRSINLKKFTRWATTARALGLDWDTERRTVAMPAEKIEKALQRVNAMLQSSHVTRTQICELLGSLRHVCSCIRPAKAFFQRLAALHRRSPRTGKIHISEASRLDLQWFDHILRYGRLQAVPLSLFGILPEPRVHIYMDASDTGLCALHPAKREFIRVQFDAAERTLIKSGAMSINVREQLSATLAILCWGGEWVPEASNQLTHIRFWIDNQSAVTWCNKLNSRDEMAKEMNRVIGAVEARWLLRVSAEHVPGSCNRMADLGSRAWSGVRLQQWQSLTSVWSQVAVPPRIRKIYMASSSHFNVAPSLNPLSANTKERGDSGVPSAFGSVHQHGCQRTSRDDNPYSWLCSPFTAGPAVWNTVASQPPPGG